MCNNAAQFCLNVFCLLLECRSVAPTAFTGYSFHTVEGAIVFANEILVCYLFPIHAGLHRIYHIFTTVIHIGELAAIHVHEPVKRATFKDQDMTTDSQDSQAQCAQVEYAVRSRIEHV